MYDGLNVDCNPAGFAAKNHLTMDESRKPAMVFKSVDNFPQQYARIGGALYLAIIVLGAFAEGFVSNKLIVSGDAATTAANILARPELWRLSVAGNFLVVLCAVPLLWIEYLLLRPRSGMSARSQDNSHVIQPIGYFSSGRTTRGVCTGSIFTCCEWCSS